MGIKIKLQARFLSGMSVRSMSQANRTAIVMVIQVPTAESTMVVASAR